jgi:hypothetical protein
LDHAVLYPKRQDSSKPPLSETQIQLSNAEVLSLACRTES